MQRRDLTRYPEELYVKIPIAALLDERMTRSSIVLYAVLIDAANGSGILEGMTIAELCRRCGGCAEKTIRRAESVLVELGYIAIHRTGRASVIEVLHSMQPTRTSMIEFYLSQREEAI